MFSFQPLLLCWNCFCRYFYLEGTLLLIQMWKKCCSVFIEVHVWDDGLSSVYCSSISSVISISSLFLDHVACLSWTETSFCTDWLFFFFFTAKPNVKLWLNCCPAATTSLFMEELKEFLFQICDVLAGYVNNVNLCVCRSQQMQQIGDYCWFITVNHWIITNTLPTWPHSVSDWWQTELLLLFSPAIKFWLFILFWDVPFNVYTPKIMNCEISYTWTKYKNYIIICDQQALLLFSPQSLL